MRQLAGWLRATHKWLALIVGVQLLIWSVSGFYMVAVQLDFIHGDFLVRNEPPVLTRGVDVLPVSKLATRVDGLQAAKLTRLPIFEHPVYVLRTAQASLLLDAVTGARLSPLPQQSIAALARAYYAGRGEVRRVELLHQVPVEVRGASAPLWRVDFDDVWNTSLYLHADDGSLITRRHRWWRVFDAFWMLHVMDYGDARDDVNNRLLTVAASLGLLLAVTGAGLLFFSFRRAQVRVS